jgi:hypothetical protein
MGSIVGKVTDAVGLTDYKGAKKAANTASDAFDASYKLGKAQINLMKEGLQFQKDQYAEWKTIYGDVEKNLSDYYKALNPTDLTAMGLQKQQGEFQAAVTEIKREAAQRGLANSGLEFAATSAAKISNAQERARIRTAAPSQVAAEKSNFLSIGLGQKGQINAGINNAYGQVGNAYSNVIASRTSQANSYLNAYSNMQAQNQDNMGSLIGLGFFL